MRRRSRLIRSLLAATLLALDVTSAPGAPGDVGVDATAAEVVGGVIVFRGEVRTASGATIAAHFVLDLGSSDGLIVPPDRLRDFGLAPADRVTIALAGGVTLADVTLHEADRAELVRPLTTDHAAELSQVPVIGLIGLGAFGDRTVQLDLTAHALRFSGSMPTPSETASIFDWVAGSTSPTFDVGATRVGLATLQVESLARSATSATTMPPIALGKIDLAGVDAYRPTVGLDVDLALGVRMLSAYRITIDRTGRRIAFEQLSVPSIVASERAYFVADQAGDADAIARFIAADPDGRLANEAALRLLALQIETRDSAKIASAIDSVAASFPLPRRAHRLTLLVDQLLAGPDAPRFDAIVQQMLDVAARSANEDLDARAIHDVHARQGLLALRAGDLPNARRFLISAAYGMPTDAHVNEWLGDLYRRERQPLRAWARYVEASLGDAPSPSALRGLDALTRDRRYQDAVSADDVELMLEGRLPSYAPSASPKSDVPLTARLVELFTNDGAPGCVAAQLAFDALRSQSNETGPAFIAYHIGPAGNAATAVDRARLYGITSLPALVVDGTPLPSVAAGGADAAGALFEAWSTRMSRTPTTAPTHSASAVLPLAISARWEGATLSIKTDTAQGQAGPLAPLIVIVVEDRVFAIGGNGLALHNAVARAAFGVEAESAGPSRGTFAVDASTLLRSNAVDGEAARARHALATPSMLTTVPRLEQCRVVVIVQDATTHQVYAAATTRPSGSVQR